MPLAYTFDGDDNIELHLGSAADGIQLIFTGPALERFMLTAGKALADLRSATPR